MVRQINKFFPGNEGGYEKYIERTGKKLKVLAPVLQSPLNRFTDMLKPHGLKEVNELEIGKSHFCIYRMISSEKYHSCIAWLRIILIDFKSSKIFDINTRKV